MKMIAGKRSIKLSCLIIIITHCFVGISQTDFDLSDTSFSIGQKYELNEISFYLHGNDRIPEECKAELDSVAKFLLNHTYLTVEISTHTDSRGKDSSNIMISQSRAEWLRNYIIQHGIDPNRIIAKGYGESEPIITEKEINKYRNTDKDRFNQLHERNRRSELKIIKIDAL